jgi:hypothetical protein
VSGDFFDHLPPGGDAYLLKWIVHDWQDDAAAKILANCRSAMAPGGGVLLVEIVMPEGSRSCRRSAVHASGSCEGRLGSRSARGSHSLPDAYGGGSRKG